MDSYRLRILGLLVLGWSVWSANAFAYPSPESYVLIEESAATQPFVLAHNLSVFELQPGSSSTSLTFEIQGALAPQSGGVKQFVVLPPSVPSGRSKLFVLTANGELFTSVWNLNGQAQLISYARSVTAITQYTDNSILFATNSGDILEGTATTQVTVVPKIATQAVSITSITQMQLTGPNRLHILSDSAFAVLNLDPTAGRVGQVVERVDFAANLESNGPYEIGNTHLRASAPAQFTSSSNIVWIQTTVIDQSKPNSQRIPGEWLIRVDLTAPRASGRTPIHLVPIQADAQLLNYDPGNDILALAANSIVETITGSGVTGRTLHRHPWFSSHMLRARGNLPHVGLFTHGLQIDHPKTSNTHLSRTQRAFGAAQVPTAPLAPIVPQAQRTPATSPVQAVPPSTAAAMPDPDTYAQDPRAREIEMHRANSAEPRSLDDFRRMSVREVRSALPPNATLEIILDAINTTYNYRYFVKDLSPATLSSLGIRVQASYLRSTSTASASVEVSVEAFLERVNEALARHHCQSLLM